MVNPVFKTQHVFNIFKIKVPKTEAIIDVVIFFVLKTIEFLNISCSKCLKTEGFLQVVIHHFNNSLMFCYFLVFELLILKVQRLSARDNNCSENVWF